MFNSSNDCVMTVDILSAVVVGVDDLSGVVKVVVRVEDGEVVERSCWNAVMSLTTLTLNSLLGHLKRMINLEAMTMLPWMMMWWRLCCWLFSGESWRWFWRKFCANQETLMSVHPVWSLIQRPWSRSGSWDCSWWRGGGERSRWWCEEPDCCDPAPAPGWWELSWECGRPCRATLCSWTLAPASALSSSANHDQFWWSGD